MLCVFPEKLFTVADKEVVDRNTGNTMEGVTDVVYYPTDMIKSDNDHGNYPFVSVRKFDEDGQLGLTVTQDPKGRNNIRMTQSTRMKYDAKVFIIAMPYHGTIAKLDSSANVQLLKAKSVRSTEYSIEFDEQKYNKILYLAINIDTRVDDTEGTPTEIIVTTYATKTVYDKNQKKRITVSDTLRRFDKKYTLNLDDQSVTFDSTETDVPSTEYSFPDKEHRPQVFHFYTPAPKKEFSKKPFNKPAYNKFSKDDEDRKPSFNRNKKFDTKKTASMMSSDEISMYSSNKPSRNNRRNNGRRNG